MSVVPIQTPRSAASDQGSTLFSTRPAIFDTSIGRKIDLLKL